MMIAEDIQFSHDIDPLAVAAYFVRVDQLRDEPDVTPMKLQKLLYLAQANYLASTGQRLFAADIEAFDHGPVAFDVWRRFSGQNIIQPESHPEVSESSVPPDVEAFLDKVWERYQDYSASALRRLTHAQDPWKEHYSAGCMRTLIPDSSMQTYFAEHVPVAQRVFHPSVVVVTPDAFDPDPEADARLDAFLTA